MTVFNHVNISGPINPAKKVTSEDMDTFQNSKFLSNLYHSIEASEKEHFNFLTFQSKRNLICQYYNRVYSEHIVTQIDSFIIESMFINNGIQYVGTVDQTPLYWDIFNQEYIIDTRDADNLLKSHTPTTDAEICSVFHLGEDEYFGSDKKQLIGNSFRNTMLKYFRQLVPYEIIALMRIALSPGGKIINPLAFKNICVLPSEYNIYSTDPSDISNPSTISKIKQRLSNSRSIKSIPQSWLDANGTTYEKLEPLIFNKTVHDMVKACFPEKAEDDIEKISNDIESSIPLFIKRRISNKSEETRSAFVHSIATFLYYRHLTLFELFPPSPEELYAIFYYHKTFIIGQRFSSEFTVCQTNFDIGIIRKIIAFQLLRSLPEALATISINNPANKWHYNYDKYQKELCAKLAINDFPMSFQEKQFFVHNTRIGSSPFASLLTTLSTITSRDLDSLESLMRLIARIYLGESIYEMITENSWPHFAVIKSNGPAYIREFLKNICCYYTTSYSLPRFSNDENISLFIKDKLKGFIANIDDSELTVSNISQFKKISSGKLVSYADPNLGKISHRNNSFCICIESQDNIEKLLKDLPHILVECQGEAKLAVYEPIQSYEALVFILASTFWLIDKYTNQSANSINNETITVSSLSSEQKIEKFLSEFCIDTTTEISREELIKIDIDTMTGSKYESDRNKVAKKLGITNLDFTYTKDLKYLFDEWYSVTYPNSCTIMDTDLIDYLQSKYSILFYLKNETGTYKCGLVKGKKGKARGFYGISVNEEKLHQYIDDTSSKKSVQSTELTERHFLSYMERVINETLDTLNIILSNG